MRIKNKEKQEKYRLPTVEEFLRYRPRRLDFEWSTNVEGLVEMIVPKFKGNLGKSFCKVIRKENMFTANMDRLGSLVWKNCDGERTVGQILEIVKKEFPEEKNTDQRLFSFIQQMESLNYIDY
ncbi:Coenzyme PQQ synthesis protein D (PqqD) [Thermoplasmatales archaeon SCGC AB-539-C06]|nr:Coenzyme PQQ synthesis protein D (PqqD) [Thermoplasmatales archaeon SCGC AB-539-C06]